MSLPYCSSEQYKWLAYLALFSNLHSLREVISGLWALALLPLKDIASEIICNLTLSVWRTKECQSFTIKLRRSCHHHQNYSSTDFPQVPQNIQRCENIPKKTHALECVSIFSQSGNCDLKIWLIIIYYRKWQIPLFKRN